MKRLETNLRQPPSGASRPRALLASLGSDEPRAYRGVLSRWPVTTDAILASLVLVLSIAAVAVSGLEDGEALTLATITALPLASFALLVVASAALMWRRAHPVAVTAVSLAAMTAWAFAGLGDGNDLPLAAAVYAVGRFVRNSSQSMVVVATAIGVSAVASLIDSHQRVDVAPAAAIVALAWYVGRRIRNRGEYLALLRERAERREADERQRVTQALADERARIARELHDVVAHQVSMMTVQAGAAKTVIATDPEAAERAMASVERAGRQALGELRHLLGALTPTTDPSNSLAPQPGIADLEELARSLEQTGATVSMAISDLPADVSAAVGLATYRIVQESVTNIVKHAGPNPVVTIEVSREGAALAITVTNSVSGGERAASVSSGYGIAGMNERAAILGGTLRADVDAAGTFSVRALLPLEMERP